MIDYKQEVLKVEPSAHSQYYYNGDSNYWITTEELFKAGKMIRYSDSRYLDKAWENAYNQLKKEGRIK